MRWLVSWRGRMGKMGERRTVAGKSKDDEGEESLDGA